jgi:hypothetical protein
VGEQRQQTSPASNIHNNSNNQLHLKPYEAAFDRTHSKVSSIVIIHSYGYLHRGISGIDFIAAVSNRGCCPVIRANGRQSRFHPRQFNHNMLTSRLQKQKRDFQKHFVYTYVIVTHEFGIE